MLYFVRECAQCLSQGGDTLIVSAAMGSLQVIDIFLIHDEQISPTHNQNVKFYDFTMQILPADITAMGALMP